MSYRRPEDVIKTSLHDAKRSRNVHEIRTLYECYIDEIVSTAQQVDDTEEGSNNYFP